RIYSFTVTRAHLSGDSSKIQRQLEMEYAGHVPGFSAFVENDEEQIVSGMVDLAKYVAVLYNNAPVANGWKMQLELTNQRKYDFVREKGKKEFSSEEKITLPDLMLDDAEVKRIRRAK
ncbi:MAG: hypothetical protein AABX39_02775, partial [Nanoarchaeota archaeon]